MIFRKKKKSKIDLRKILSVKEKNYKIIGYGATAKSTTVLNYCSIDNKYIGLFLDTTPDKQNKFTPGTKIKVLKYKNGIKRM